ncbi:MAG: PHP domain-containing protein [Candidatus Aenigmarchaeota archaeon]|nr:PHP domain-containing protein [Candidatus Aenigmarchaeota archaeon]
MGRFDSPALTKEIKQVRQEVHGGRFEFHCHSRYSRGTKVFVEGLPSPKEIIAYAKRMGLAGVAISDHDTNKAWAEAKAEARKQGVVFIPAMEILSSAGHIIGLGLTEPVRRGMDPLDTMDAIRGQGAVCVAVHPFDVQSWGIRKFMDHADAVEVFNALSLDRLGNMAAERRAKKKGKVMVAGSDAHSLDMIGTACNIIDAGSIDEVLVSLRQGKVSFERNYSSLPTLVEWVRERLFSSYPQVLSYINANYRGPKRWLARNMLNNYVFSGHEKWESLAPFGLGIATAYSAVKVIAYY